MIAENDIHMKEAAKKMYTLSADEMIEERCRARNYYQKEMNTHNRTLRELEEANQTIESQKHEIEQLRKQIAELQSHNN